MGAQTLEDDGLDPDDLARFCAGATRHLTLVIMGDVMWKKGGRNLANQCWL